MILVDTSVWINHIREENLELSRLLNFRHENPVREVVCHPFVIGEIILGSISRRKQMTKFLYSLTSIAVADHHSVIEFINEEKLYTTGLSFVDCHLLLASVLNEGLFLWTHDKQLAKQAAHRNLNFFPNYPDT